MTITINGTTGIAGVDGSAGTPAVQGTDTNTGVFYPAADTVGVSTGGSERVRVDSSGNVGIGTSSPSYRLHVAAAGNTLGGYFYTPSGLSGIRIETAANDKAIAEFYTNGNRNWSIGPGQTTAGAFEFRDVTAASTRMLIDSSGNLLFNSGFGSVATAYGCRAWVNFNGTGVVAIRASGNVSSITDNGTGDYTVNFTTAMPDANYSMTASASCDGSGNNIGVGVFQSSSAVVNPTTSAARMFIFLRSTGGAVDVSYINAQIAR